MNAHDGALHLSLAKNQRRKGGLRVYEGTEINPLQLLHQVSGVEWKTLRHRTLYYDEISLSLHLVEIAFGHSKHPHLTCPLRSCREGPEYQISRPPRMNLSSFHVDLESTGRPCPLALVQAVLHAVSLAATLLRKYRQIQIPINKPMIDSLAYDGAETAEMCTEHMAN